MRPLKGSFSRAGVSRAPAPEDLSDKEPETRHRQADLRSKSASIACASLIKAS